MEEIFRQLHCFKNLPIKLSFLNLSKNQNLNIKNPKIYDVNHFIISTIHNIFLIAESQFVGNYQICTSISADYQPVI